MHMMMNRMKSFVLVLLMLFAGLLPFSAYAEGGGGNGSGPSGGSSGVKPLSFVSITLSDGGANVLNAKDIPLKPKFKLLFDKNVVNSTIWEINRNCFSLTSQEKEDVPIEVTKVDDSVDFSLRQAIFVEPSVSLKQGVTYNLRVKPDLVAKNGEAILGGTTSGKGVTIVFATKGEAAGADKASSNPSVVSPASSEPAGGTEPAGTAQEQAGKGQPEAAGGQGAAGNPAAQAAQGQGAAAGSSGGNGTSNAAPAVTVDTAAAKPGSPAENSANPSPEAATAAEKQSSMEAASGKSGEQASASPHQADGVSAVSETGTGDPHWRLMIILTAVLAAGWVALELLVFRHKRAKKRLEGQGQA